MWTPANASVGGTWRPDFDMTPGPSPNLLLQMVNQNHEMAEAGHRRLRDDVRDMEKEIDKLAAEQRSLAALNAALLDKFTKLESTPLNVERVSFSGKQLAAIVGACLSLAAGMIGVVVKVDGLQTSIASAQKLQDDRNETTRAALDQLRASLELRRVEIQNLSNYIQQNVTPRQGSRP